MRKYSYDGPVMEFEKCIANRWQGTTYAVSPNKARSNLAFRFKKQTNRTARAKITLPGKLVVVEEEEEAV
jgi:hypothetical protein